MPVATKSGGKCLSEADREDSFDYRALVERHQRENSNPSENIGKPASGFKILLVFFWLYLCFWLGSGGYEQIPGRYEETIIFGCLGLFMIAMLFVVIGIAKANDGRFFFLFRL